MLLFMSVVPLVRDATEVLFGADAETVPDDCDDCEGEFDEELSKESFRPFLVGATACSCSPDGRFLNTPAFAAAVTEEMITPVSEFLRSRLSRLGSR